MRHDIELAAHGSSGIAVDVAAPERLRIDVVEGGVEVVIDRTLVNPVNAAKDQVPRPATQCLDQHVLPIRQPVALDADQERKADRFCFAESLPVGVDIPLGLRLPVLVRPSGLRRPKAVNVFGDCDGLEPLIHRGCNVRHDRLDRQCLFVKWIVVGPQVRVMISQHREVPRHAVDRRGS